MSFWTNIGTWFVNNYIALIVAGIIILYISYRIYKNRQKVEVKEEVIHPVPEPFFTPQYTKPDYAEQKKETSNEIEKIRQEGKGLVDYEEKLKAYILQQQMLLNNKRKNLDLRFAISNNTLANLNQIIELQKQLKEGLKVKKE